MNVHPTIAGTPTIMDDIRLRRMTSKQFVVVAICLVINLIDGFDVLAMAFTAPAVAGQFGLQPDQVGMLLSAGLAGMAIGALTLSPLADVVGRKPITISCLMLAACGMLAAGVSGSFVQLLLARVVTGIGIGAMIGSVSSLLIEYSSVAMRGIATGLMAVMFPAGAVIGGAVTIALIQSYGWQPVFLTGGAATLALIPFVLLYVPESVDHLLARRRPDSLPRINRILVSLHARPLSDMPQPPAGIATTRHFGDLLRPPLRAKLLLLGAIMFLMMTSFYFILNWAPKLLVEAGTSASAGITSGMLINLGGMAGGISIGLLLRTVSLRACTIGVLGSMAIGIALFGVLAGNPAVAVPLALALGFVLFGAMVVTFMLMTTSFPASVRATSVGICTTVGRFGVVLGPVAAGILLANHMSIGTICIVMAMPVLFAAIMMMTAPRID